MPDQDVNYEPGSHNGKDDNYYEIRINSNIASTSWQDK